MRLVYIALGWVVGMVLAANDATRLPLVSIIWLALAALAAVAAALSWRSVTQRWVMIGLVALALGGLRMTLVPVTSAIARYNNSGGLTIEGWVGAEPEARDDRVLLRVEAQTLTQAGQTVLTSGLVLVQAPPITNVRYGDRIAATGMLVTPAESDTFSYADYLARSGVFSIMPTAAVEIIPDMWQGNTFYAALLDLKSRVQAHVSHYLPEPESSLLSGILLNNEQGIAPEISDAFSAVGAAHIIAISGFNMTILSGVVVNILERAGVRARWSALLGIVIIAVYTLFVGASAAVVRATIMSSLLVIGTAIKRKTFVPASLALVVLLVSLQNPTALWDVGFQLSFFAVLGLALFTEPLSRWFNRRYSRRSLLSDLVFEPLIVTLAVQITTLPLIVAYFGRVSLVTIAVNLLVVPVQAALLILGIVASIVAFILPAVAQVLYWIDGLLLSWTINVVRQFARLPFADVAFHVDPRLVAIFFIVLIGGAMLQATQPAWALQLASRIRRRTVVVTTALAGGGIALLMLAAALSRPDGNLHIWMLDMGHSNAVFVETPGGAHILVDGGRFPSRLLTALGERMPFTDRTIEVLVMTQPDDYDTSALVAVLDRYAVGAVLTSGHESLGETAAVLRTAFVENGVLQVQARAGYRLDMDDGTRIEVLHPREQPALSDSLDDHTLTLRLSYGEMSFLLTSDLSGDGQTALLEAGEWPLASVMQLPRHGTVGALREQFLLAVQPQAVVLQADPANRLGDPNADTLALLDANTPLWRTDTQGTIHLWTDGRSLWSDQPAS